MVIGYLALGVISRLYLPAEIGIGKYFVTMLTLVGAVASLRYEDALMLPRKDEDAAVLIWLSAAVMLLTAVLLTVLAIWSTEIARFLDFPAIAPYLPLVPLTLVCMRSGKIAEFWLVRKRAFRHISAGHVNLTAAMVVGRIGAGAPPINANEAGHIGWTYWGVYYCQRLFYLACLPSQRCRDPCSFWMAKDAPGRGTLPALCTLFNALRRHRCNHGTPDYSADPILFCN